MRTDLLIGGEWVSTSRKAPVLDKYSGATIVEYSVAEREHVSAAVAAAQKAFEKGPPAPYARYEILSRAADLLAARKAQFVDAMVKETGEETLRLSAEEAKRITGEMIPISSFPGQERRMAFTLRVPVGVVCAITPFNSPLNTVMHKVAPALAAGNPVVLKPAGYTPLCSSLLCELLVEAGLPAGFISLVNGPGGSLGDWLLAEQAIRFYTFTGSTAVGHRIQAAAGLRRTQMECGSIACTIVCADADIDRALPRLLAATFRKAGQVCTSIQRLYVEKSILNRFTQRFIAAIQKEVKLGDPSADGTFVGPLIDPREADRVASWVAEARDSGAEILSGGKREGYALLQPTVITGVNDKMRVFSSEAFGPIVCLVPFDDFNDVIRDINATPYGLATGVFTNDLARAFEAAQKLDVGGIHINETSSSRVDLMPYGGMKESGFGREGPRYAIREMTEEKIITIAL
jgi:succinate-semialdehyde dehydrogenase / glutarate-semialdehyde dehydrogenase